MIEGLFSLKGKTALVTGGSRGIGRMIAEGYVESGAKVYISSRKRDVCDEVAAELSKKGECISLPADLATEADAKSLAKAIGEREGSLNILVNNAGNTWAAPLEEYDEKAWERVLSLNLKGIFHLTRELTPLLEKAGQPGDPARVINIGSIDGIWVPEYESYAYSASKAAVHQMTRVLATKLGPRRIAVSAIAPGYFESKMTAYVYEHDGAKLLAGNPLGRLGSPTDIAGTAIFLASKAGAYINGSVLVVDGGQHLGRTYDNE